MSKIMILAAISCLMSCKSINSGTSISAVTEPPVRRLKIPRWQPTVVKVVLSGKLTNGVAGLVVYEKGYVIGARKLIPVAHGIFIREYYFTYQPRTEAGSTIELIIQLVDIEGNSVAETTLLMRVEQQFTEVWVEIPA